MSIMPAILRLLGLAAILAAILLLSPAHVHACDCSEKLGLNDADLVFEGSLDTSTRWWTRQDNQELVRHRFTVSKPIKGPVRTEYLVDTGLTDCGVPFLKKGAAYSVFARKSRDPESEWWLSVCSMTKEIGAAATAPKPNR